MGLVFYTFAPEMFLLFCPQESQRPIISAGVPVLRLVAFAMPALACTIIFTSALRGAGDTRVPVLFTWIGFFAVRIPLAYLLAFSPLDLGPFGFYPEGMGLFGHLARHVRGPPRQRRLLLAPLPPRGVADAEGVSPANAGVDQSLSGSPLEFAAASANWMCTSMTLVLPSQSRASRACKRTARRAGLTDRRASSRAEASSLSVPASNSSMV